MTTHRSFSHILESCFFVGFTSLALSSCAARDAWLTPEGTSATIEFRSGGRTKGELVGGNSSTLLIAFPDSFQQLSLSSINSIDLDIPVSRTWLLWTPLQLVPSLMEVSEPTKDDQAIGLAGLAVTAATAGIMELSGPKTAFSFPLDEDDSLKILSHFRYPFPLADSDIRSFVNHGRDKRNEQPPKRTLASEKRGSDIWVQLTDGSEVVGEILHQDRQFLTIHRDSRRLLIPVSKIEHQRAIEPRDLGEESTLLRWRITLDDGKSIACKKLIGMEGDSVLFDGLSASFIVHRNSIRELRALNDKTFIGSGVSAAQYAAAGGALAGGLISTDKVGAFFGFGSLFGVLAFPIGGFLGIATARNDVYDFSKMSDQNRLQVLQIIISKETATKRF